MIHHQEPAEGRIRITLEVNPDDGVNVMELAVGPNTETPAPNEVVARLLEAARAIILGQAMVFGPDDLS